MPLEGMLASQGMQSAALRAEEHLNDDLHVVNLSIDVVRAPPIELWPNPAPSDVQELLLTPLTGPKESGPPEQA